MAAELIATSRAASNGMGKRSSEGADLHQMKETNNNAIDLLLRSLARGEGDDPSPGADSAFRVGGDRGTVSDHLDADELNLYAEGVLAPPARTRYTAHLADCQRCRSLVVGLAQSAGRAVQHETKKQGEASFWASLGALLSIPVLRYAIPAVLLIGVLGIGLLALRDQTGSDLVAVNQKTDLTAPNPQSTGNSENPQESATQPPQEKPDANPGDLPRAAANAPAGDKGLLSQQADSRAEKTNTVGAVPREAVSPATPGITTVQPGYAPDPVSAPAPPPKAVGEFDTRSSLRKEKEDYLEREVAKRNQDELKLAAKDDSPSHGPSRSRTLSGGSRRDDVTVTSENRAAPLKDKKEAAEETDTRTVSGRHFQRRGNAWIDTAYNSSRSVTNIGRGTEQFRALMADEPGLRAIVQQLAGEVVVVWKNRTYRIR